MFKKTDANHTAYFDVLRIIACVLVVFIHVSASFVYQCEVGTVDWYFANFYNNAKMYGVSVFFMISGALLLNKDYDLTFKKLFTKKIFKLAVLFIVWSTIYNFTAMFRPEYADVNKLVIMAESFINAFANYGPYHVWFLLTLAMLYVLSPILKEAFRKKEICRYFLILFTFCGAIVPTIRSFDWILEGALNRYQVIYDATMLTGHIGYFVLGHYLHNHTEAALSKRKKIALCIMLVLATAASVVINFATSLKAGIFTDVLGSPLDIFSFVGNYALFLLVRDKMKNVGGSGKALKLLSGLTLGIYLLHPMILEVAEKLGLLSLTISAAVLIPVCVFIVCLVSAVITWILKKIPVVNKWLV